MIITVRLVTLFKRMGGGLWKTGPVLEMPSWPLGDNQKQDQRLSLICDDDDHDNYDMHYDDDYYYYFVNNDHDSDDYYQYVDDDDHGGNQKENHQLSLICDQ